MSIITVRSSSVLYKPALNLSQSLEHSQAKLKDTKKSVQKNIKHSVFGAFYTLLSAKVV